MASTPTVRVEPVRWVVVLLCACGPSQALRTSYSNLIHPASECRQDAPTQLSSDAVQSDFDTFERIVRRGYAGYPFFSEANWASAFQTTREQLRGVETSVAFRDVLAERFAFLQDNHVGFWTYQDGRRSWRGVGGHHQAYVGAMRFTERDGQFYAAGAAKLVHCEGFEEVIQPVLSGSDVTLRPLVLSPEPVESIQCQFDVDGHVSERTLPLTKLEMNAPRGPAFERIEAPFAWVRLRTLFTDRAGALDRFVESAAEVRDAPVVVLDLRRTGGGSDRYLIRWFGQLLQRDLQYWRRGRLSSEVVLQGGLNFWECVRASNPTDEGGSVWIDARIERAHRELDEAMNEQGEFRDLDVRTPMVFGEAPSAFEGRLLVVTDRRCASACETAALLARQVPGAVVIGENTGGVMKVGEMRRYRLPNSRVGVSLGHQSHEDPNGAFRESYGFLPDVWMDGENPDAEISAVAQCLMRADCSLRFR